MSAEERYFTLLAALGDVLEADDEGGASTTLVVEAARDRMAELAALRARLAEAEAREHTAKAEALAWALARVGDALKRAVADVVDSLQYQIDLENYAANSPAKEPPIISTGVLVASGPRAPLVIEDDAAAQPATDPQRSGGGVGEADVLFQQPSGAEPARPDAPQGRWNSESPQATPPVGSGGETPTRFERFTVKLERKAPHA